VEYNRPTFPGVVDLGSDMQTPVLDYNKTLDDMEFSGRPPPTGWTSVLTTDRFDPANYTLLHWLTTLTVDYTAAHLRGS